MNTFKKFLAENKYTEIEFLCYNSEYPTGTKFDDQKKLFNDLKKLGNDVIPFYQNHSDEDHKEYSLTAIILDKSKKSEVLALAKKYNIDVDLEQKVNDRYVDRVVSGSFENQIN